jgi:hypothetical protein
MTSVRKTYRRRVSCAVAQSANPQKVPLDHPNPSRIGRRRSQQCDAKKVSAELCRQPSLGLQRSNPWRKWVASFPQSRLCRFDLIYNLDTDVHPRIGRTHDVASLKGLHGRDPVADE